MIGMDVFSGSAFSTMSLSATIDKMEHVPTFIGGLGIFEPSPIQTRLASFDRRTGTLELIPSSEVGSAPVNLASDPRDMIQIPTARLAKGFTLYASQIAGIREFGSMSALENAQSMFIRNMGRVRNDMEATHEFHRLGAIQGKVLDADGTTVLYNFFDEFSESETSAVNFALTTDTTDVRTKCAEVIRGMARASKGTFTPMTSVHALAGDEFFDNLIKHPSVIRTYQNWQAAEALREGKAFESFKFGEITFHNYRGADEIPALRVTSGEAKFFPVGANGFFKKCMAPHETMEFVNMPGQDTYAERLFEREGNPRESKFVRGDLYSYPLYVCTRPGALRKAVQA